jgi:GNAT superfamily N-acetyltransferase
MPTRIVQTQEERVDLDALLDEYELSLSPDLRHDRVPPLDEASVAILATWDGAAQGCVFVTHLDPATAIIQRLYVRPQARGRGLARALMQHATAYARERGYRRLVLDTDKQQLEPAYRLYLSLGFTECEPYAAVTYANPTYMELPLTVSS